MKKAGAEIVSHETVEKLMDWLEEYSKLITTCALDVSKKSKRKKITYGDMRVAIWLLSGTENRLGIKIPPTRKKIIVKKKDSYKNRFNIQGQGIIEIRW